MNLHNQEFQEHNPVMLSEVLNTINVVDGGTYIDATFGAGGYTSRILKKANCKVYGIDRDCSSSQYFKNIDQNLQKNFNFIHGNFANITDLLYDRKVFKVNGVIFDIGVSSMQLDIAERGFSFMQSSKLDMRMDQEQTLSAFDVVNTYSQFQLEQIISTYGEERAAKRIAAAIINARKLGVIETTEQLARIVAGIKGRNFGKIHPATQTFQAIRIEVNNELNNLKLGLEGAVKLLDLHGTIVVVTFHSLEDEIVKNYFNTICRKKIKINKYKTNSLEESGAECFINMYKKPLIPSFEEIRRNPRSRSAKLRAISRIT